MVDGQGPRVRRVVGTNDLGRMRRASWIPRIDDKHPINICSIYMGSPPFFICMYIYIYIIIYIYICIYSMYPLGGSFHLVNG